MKPLWMMSADELDETLRLSRQSDRELLAGLFGEAGALRYARLERTADHSPDLGRADEAARELEEMQGGLSDEGRNSLFGIGELQAVPEPGEVSEYVRALGRLDFRGARELGTSLCYAFIQGGAADLCPRRMREKQRVGFAQIRTAAEHARAAGWSYREVLEAAQRAILALYDDWQDGALMSAPIARMLFKADQSGEWKFAAACAEAGCRGCAEYAVEIVE